MVMNRPSDSQLAQRCQRGDRSAFDELVGRYRGAIYGFALQRVGDPEGAAEVAQEAFVEAYCCLGSLREPQRFAPWLRSITANLCADWARQASRREQPQDETPEPSLACSRLDPSRELERQEVRRAVWAAIQSLSRANRIAVTLFYFDGLSCREVADFCGVSVSAIKSRLHEARTALREETAMSDPRPADQQKPELPGAMVYSGDGCVGVLFWSKEHTKELYLALYPEKRRDDESFWNEWRHVKELDGILRLWEYAGAVREEDGRLVGLVPVYTEQDHEMFAAWHARVSQAILERLCAEEAAIEGLVQQFHGGNSDPGNLRQITIVGRLIAHGMTDVLTEGFMGSAHDWGGLGRAFIQGQRGYGLPPCGGYSLHECGPEGAHFATFQLSMTYPGRELMDEYGSERVAELLVGLCRSPRAREELLATEKDESSRARLEAILEGLTAARWVAERDGLLQVALPWLPWGVAQDSERIRDMAGALTEPIADAAEELKVLAAQCSFARCRFADVAYMVTSKMISYVVRDIAGEGVLPFLPDPTPPGCGAWLYVSQDIP